MKNTQHTADDFFQNAKKWQEEMLALRSIVLECGLKEEIKWGQPVYTHLGKNIVLINGFKDKCILGFFKGALLTDKDGILEKQGVNTQSSRIIRFTQSDDIHKLDKTLKAYIKDAINAELSGKAIAPQEPEKIQIPAEFELRLEKSASLKKAFNNLTPGRQRAYLMYFSAAKQSATRESRIDQYKDRILKGFGFHDCVCGLSKKMPSCDGSHKILRQK